MKYITVVDPRLSFINIEKQQFTAEELRPFSAEISDRLLSQGMLWAVFTHTKFNEQRKEEGSFSYGSPYLRPLEWSPITKVDLSFSMRGGEDGNAVLQAFNRYGGAVHYFRLLQIGVTKCSL
jgi:hypothetical protein